MLRQRVIQKWAAGLLSLMLLLGIMPKPAVHEWLTGHKHAVTVALDNLHVESTNTLLSCDCELAVFASPFEAASESDSSTIAILHPYFSTYLPTIYTDNVPEFRALRGPPTLL